MTLECSIGQRLGLCGGQSYSSTSMWLIHVFMDLEDLEQKRIILKLSTQHWKYEIVQIVTLCSIHFTGTEEELQPFTTFHCAAADVRLECSCLAMEAQSISSLQTVLELFWCLKVWFYGPNPVTWLLSFTTASALLWSQHWAIARMDSERLLEFSELLPWIFSFGEMVAAGNHGSRTASVLAKQNE